MKKKLYPKVEIFLKSLYSYTDTEQFIEDLVDDCTEQYFVDVTCKVKSKLYA